MTSREARAVIRAFRALGYAGQVTFNFGGTGTPGRPGRVTSVCLQARLELDRGEDLAEILDIATEEAIVSSRS